MAAKAFGIVNFSKQRIWVEGMQEYRSISAFSFLGRYRIIDFPISNMSNSGIEHVQVYVREKPASIVAHVGSGRHYNINSKRGKVSILFSNSTTDHDIYNNDITSYVENLEKIQQAPYPYVVITPGYMIYTQDYNELLQEHIDSGADITLMYHTVDNADEYYLNCDTLSLNRQNGVKSIDRNRGNAKNRNVFMETYIMKKDLLLELIEMARNLSSLFSLVDIINVQVMRDKLDVRGVAHHGFFASSTDFKSYYRANLDLIHMETAETLFRDDWPIYTRTNDSCPTKYSADADVKSSVVSNGCHIAGSIENSVIGRDVTIEKGAVVKNCVVLPDTIIGEDVHIENLVVDKHAKVTQVKEIIADPGKPGYIKRKDVL